MFARPLCERGADTFMFCCEWEKDNLAHFTECDEFWENITAAAEGNLTERRMWLKAHFDKVACCIAAIFHIGTRRDQAGASASATAFWKGVGDLRTMSKRKDAACFLSFPFRTLLRLCARHHGVCHSENLTLIQCNTKKQLARSSENVL